MARRVRPDWTERQARIVHSALSHILADPDMCQPDLVATPSKTQTPDRLQIKKAGQR